MSAEQQLQELVAGVRREAKAEGDAEGYARAWREIMAVAEKSLASPRKATPDLFDAPKNPATPSSQNGSLLLQGALTRLRRPRGQNRDLVFLALEIAGQPVGATQVQRLLKNDKLAYSSVRNALSQLVEAGTVIEHPGGLFEVAGEATKDPITFREPLPMSTVIAPRDGFEEPI